MTTRGDRADPQLLDPADYEAAKQMARSADPAVRRRVAASPETRPELLYFLAADAVTEVRQAIATNAGTPRQADLMLAKDREVAVRGALAQKVARLLPDLSADQASQIERLTLECLEALARDQATEVRGILSEALKELPGAPHGVINTLARDVELSVCAPVLQFSPILTDEDLSDIIMRGPVAGALSAIAGRKQISASVADAIARSDDEAAMTALLANPSAQIREETLDRILDQAPQHEPWHAPLVRRPRLPARAVARLASFVADNLLKVLRERTDLDPAAARALAEGVRARVNRGAGGNGGGGAGMARGLVDFGEEELGHLPGDKDKAAERPADKAARLNKEGKLTEKLLEGALAEGDRAFVLAGLGELAQLPMPIIDRIIGTHAPRAVTSLVWRCGLSMRFARQVQLRIAQIPPKTALMAKEGVLYPMSDDEMRWQLAFFGVEEKV
ncbi:hypothetical protein ABAZ39_01585 [Azospirillum argentinense]|uniref:DUF2336 domain-containing protein n=1 Tax=Azospirillum argentinense TaxID=2970906 RepID=A0A060DDG4_9PROT|nr:DUF2336 domain-containing protein [Azospirillum argentinense]AIB10730.1 hypothetical protein ABAZ39_01585 [Azospirillum argentinense]EZQ07707.1 hypothetical protein ABAZ39_03015 [Azospirillum argentinense]